MFKNGHTFINRAGRGGRIYLQGLCFGYWMVNFRILDHHGPSHKDLSCCHSLTDFTEPSLFKHMHI